MIIDKGRALLRQTPLDTSSPVRFASLESSSRLTGIGPMFPAHWGLADGFLWSLVLEEGDAYWASPHLSRFALEDMRLVDPDNALPPRGAHRTRRTEVPPYPLLDAIAEGSNRDLLVFPALQPLSRKSVRLFVLQPPVLTVWVNEDPALFAPRTSGRSVEGRVKEKGRIENWLKVASISVPFAEPFEVVGCGSVCYFITGSGDLYADKDLKASPQKIDTGGRRVTAILTLEESGKVYLCSHEDYAPLSDSPGFKSIPGGHPGVTRSATQCLLDLAKALK
ncbi:MAG: hypothetical protein IT209_02435 [Armatimonadetes bacterium]|nr:hypothetical protein [Armatimonadota bacterium]